MRRILLFLLGLVSVAYAQVSPFDYGLREAQGGMGRYFALLNAHRAAHERGLEVCYAGIDTLRLDLPPNWASLPVGPHADLGGVVLYVTNNSHHGALFTYVPFDSTEVPLPDSLRPCHTLRILYDSTPWTERRGFGYQHYRSDIVELDAHAQPLNDPIAPWDTDSTRMRATLVAVDTAHKSFRHVTMHRTKQSTFKTHLLSVSRVSHYAVEDVHVTTPRSRMIADGIISITQSVHVKLNRILVEGTYSGYGSTRNYGYAFQLNNIYDLRCSHIRAWGNWGVFGANNMHLSQLTDCQIDRYDVHCYGRDIHLRRCILAGRQIPISSIFGRVTFDSCFFNDFTPVRIRASYNAYTPFDIEIHDCVFRPSLRYHSLVQVDLLDTADNPRPELRQKCLPNLDVDGLVVEVPLTVGRLNIYRPKDNLADLARTWGYIDHVKIHRLSLQRPNGIRVKIPIRLFSHPVTTEHPVHYTLD